MARLHIAATIPYVGLLHSPAYSYQIATAQDLIALGQTPADYNKYFILTADIDLSAHTFDRAVIAPYSVSRNRARQDLFTGVFVGNNHVIHNLHLEGQEYLGPSRYLGSSAVVRHVGLENVSIEGPAQVIGGLAGRNF